MTLEAVDMPWLMIGLDDPDDDDAEKAANDLLHTGEWCRTPLGWTVTARADSDRKRAQARARQAKSRAKKRHADSVTDSVTRHAPESENSTRFGGEVLPPPTPKAKEEEGVTPERHAMSRRDSHAECHAESVTEQPWNLPPMSDEQRDTGRAQSAAILDRMRNGEL